MNERILFVDDEQHILDAVRSNLKKYYTIETCANPRDTLAKIKNGEEYSVIVSDLKMPDMGGVDFLSAVRGLTPDTVRVMLTGFADLETALFAVNNNIAYKFLEKPYKTHELREMIEDCIALYNKTIFEKFENSAKVIMNHDIKGPMLGIVSLSSMLLGSENVPLDTKEALQAIHTSGSKILRILESKALLEKMERGVYKKNVSGVRIFKTIKDAIGEQAKILESKKIDIKITIDGQEYFDAFDQLIECDEHLLTCILGNILKNAVEASCVKDVIIIDVKRDKDMLISVRNCGEVPADIQERFFEKYVTQNKPYGTGVGTYSAKLMVTALGGDIHLDTSEPGHTTIHIRIPIG
ncbi:MAG: hybrid sensor histidine kinase/response regulator [Desulfovibrio sp.]|nr:hybrid sensor histidine kinase/response regulator [Desulfovibrio sp.]MBI4961292.1 hybrid sensor histidine kinase/response regulator [Desulfovibrio sp.]